MKKKPYTPPDIKSEKVEGTALADSCCCDCPPGDRNAFIPGAVSVFLGG